MPLGSAIRDWVLRSRDIPHTELSKLLFGQQHIGNQRFLQDNFRQYHTVELVDMPHYRFLDKHLAAPFSGNIYEDYLTASWSYLLPERNTGEGRRKKIEEFLALYRDVQQKAGRGAKAVEKPIQVCRRPDGRVVIVSGNHRASVALKLGLDVRARFVSVNHQLRRIASNPDEFYGSKRLGMPYQSIVHQGKTLVAGRRADIYERIGKIRPEDLRDKTVADLGCNLGMSSFAAAEAGAVRVTGVEYSPKIASAAIRLNAYFGLPCEFMLHDLSLDLDLPGHYDTVFCFSLVNHLKSPDAITRLIKRITRKVLYFEGHARTKLEDYSYLLNGGNFSKIELVDYLSNGITSKKRTRPFFRCEV
jgi:Methyltransferase domain